MLDDLAHLKSLGIDGFVFGALSPGNHLDIAACRRILEAARPLPVTFHRAFDELVDDPLVALDQIRELGFARLLTSGQASSAEAGLEVIEKLVARAGEGLVVMPGAGITDGNIARLRDGSGAREFHGSAKRSGADGKGAGVTVSDVETVRRMVKVLRAAL